MQVHHNAGGSDPVRLRADFTRDNRKGIAKALENQERDTQSGDRVELSSAARSIAELNDAAQESAEYRAKVQEIIEHYRNGSLDTPERVERAAEGLLSGDS